MAEVKFNHAVIRGVCTVIPKSRICLDDEKQFYSDEAKIKKLKVTVGLCTRAVVAPGTTPSDLMEFAANRLIKDMNVNTGEIDALVCVLDFPDYRLPPTSCVLHGKLDMPSSCMAFDINHGCAGYVYGLYTAYAMIESGAAKRVLLLVGDTKSRTIDVRDRVSAPIFGDGAAATLLEHTDAVSESWFVLGANGKLYENIIVPAGGARRPCSDETREAVSDAFGNVRSAENFFMNGREVFDFTMNTVPSNIAKTIALSGKAVSELDFFVLHQANKSIIQNIAIRSGIRDMSRVPTETLSRYGNLSVASIPSVFNDALSHQLQNGRCTMLISGFGVGLAYGSAILTTESLFAPQPFAYQGE